MVADAAASPSPAPAPAPHAAAGRPHPTYTMMIMQALMELGGASRRGAIAACIRGRGYSSLPARHDDLLSAHLRRLLAEGVLLRLDADGPSSSCTYLLAPKPPAGGEEQKRGPGRPRKEKPAAAAMSPAGSAAASRGFKRGCGRSRKDQPVGGTGVVEEASGARRDKEDLVPRTEEGVAPGVSGENAAGAVGSDHPGSAGASVEQEGGTPRMEESAAAAAARSLETTRDAAASTAGVKRGRGRPRKNPPAAAAMSAETVHAASTAVKRGRGRPPKNKPTSTGGVKRGRGRPRKEKPAATAATGVAGVKRGRRRPMRAGSVGTWYAESASERELFGNMAEEEAPGDREEARVADDAGRVPVSGENAAAAPVEAGNGSDFGHASL